MFGEPPDHTGNEPKPDVQKECSRQNIKYINSKYMPLNVMNKVIINQVYGLSTERRQKTYK